MTAVKVCSICTGAIVGFGNDAQPINDGRCCDRCHAERVVPERARRMLERDAKREGNGGALQCLQYNRSDRWLRSRIRYSRVGFAAADAKRQNVGGMTGIESRWTRLKLSCRLACEASGAAP